MRVSIRLGLRDWDYITPLLTGEVTSRRIDLHTERVDWVPGALAENDRFDAVEISFAQYVAGRARGDDGVFGVPNFVMRGFRHRCGLTLKESDLTRFEDLKGKRIGITGWQDSGSIWTRAALARAGVGVDDAEWFVGRLNGGDGPATPLGAFRKVGRVEPLAEGASLVGALQAGELDAIFAPFLPQGFFSLDSPLRNLLPDFKADEIAYYNAVGYVPGHHALGVKTALVERYPWLPGELSDLVDASRRLWLDKRRRYADTSPWVVSDLVDAARALAPDWEASGVSQNRKMIEDFADEMFRQGCVSARLSAEQLFPEPAFVSETI